MPEPPRHFQPGLEALVKLLPVDLGPGGRGIPERLTLAVESLAEMCTVPMIQPPSTAQDCASFSMELNLTELKLGSKELGSAEVSAVLFMLRCLGTILGRSSWTSDRHLHALELFCSLAKLPRYRALLLSAGLVSRLVVQLKLHAGGLEGLVPRAREAVVSAVVALGDREAAKALNCKLPKALTSRRRGNRQSCGTNSTKGFRTLAAALVQLEGGWIRPGQVDGNFDMVTGNPTKQKLFDPVLVGMRGGAGPLGAPSTDQEKAEAKSRLQDCADCTARARSKSIVMVQSLIDKSGRCPGCRSDVVYYQPHQYRSEDVISCAGDTGLEFDAQFERVHPGLS